MIMETLRQATPEQRQETITIGNKILSLCDSIQTLWEKNVLTNPAYKRVNF